MEGDPLGVDRETMRELGYRTVDLLVDVLHDRTVPPLRRATRQEMEERLAGPAPELGEDFGHILEQLTRDVIPFTSRGDHPGYFAFIPSCGTWPGALGDLVASALNVFSGSWMESAGPSQMELSVLDWFKEWVGYPHTAAGVLVSGGSAANMTALACAREALLGAMSDRVVIYCSDQAHSSMARGARVLGFRPDQVRVLPVDADYRLRADRVEAAMDADLAVGRQPMLVAASAGSTNTGAVDHLGDLAGVCRDRGVWFHVDGAYGGFAALTDRGRRWLQGMELADSVTLDPHKWLYQPFECGCLLVREGRLLRGAFEITPDYLHDAETAQGEVNFSDLGVQLSRMSRAFKLWISLRYFGVGAFRDAIDRSLDLAGHAQRRIEASPGLEPLLAPKLSVVCFRRRPEGFDDEDALEAANTRIVAALADSGLGLISSTRLRGRYALRMCVLNHTTRQEDVDRVLDWIEAAPVTRAPVAGAAVQHERHPQLTDGWLGRAPVEPGLVDSLPLFQALDASLVNTVAGAAREQRAFAGETIVRQWDCAGSSTCSSKGEPWFTPTASAWPSSASVTSSGSWRLSTGGRGSAIPGWRRSSPRQGCGCWCCPAPSSTSWPGRSPRSAAASSGPSRSAFPTSLRPGPVWPPPSQEGRSNHELRREDPGVGLGGVSRCTLPLLFGELGIEPSRFTVVDFGEVSEHARQVEERGARFVSGRITPDNLGEMLGRLVAPGDIVVDLAWNIDTMAMLEWCRARDVRFVNASIEIWDPYEGFGSEPPPDRTLYVRHMALRKMIAGWGDNDGPSAVLDHGANPGLVSHFTKAALEDLAEAWLADMAGPTGSELGERVDEARRRGAFNHMAHLLGVKVIHISERDTQISNRPKQENEFVNTWSVEGFHEEGIAPAEMGWGTHERALPPGAHEHASGPRNQICLARPGCHTWVRSWVPCGEIVGMVIRHGEAFSISDHLTVTADDGAPVYRPTVHYAYCPADAAIASLHELHMSRYELQPRRRIMTDDIVEGRDELGCLLMGHGFKSWWIGSLLDIDESRRLVPHQNATTLQVAASLLAAVKWLIANPRRGVCLPDDLPHRFILDAAKPYLGPFVSTPVDWTPLDRWVDPFGGYGRPRPPEEDVWQFTTFLV